MFQIILGGTKTREGGRKEGHQERTQAVPQCLQGR